MNPVAHVESALHYWRLHPLRAILSMLGITIGVAGFVVVVALSEGARREIKDMMSLFGTDILIVDADREGAPAMSMKELDRICTTLGSSLAALAPVRLARAEAWMRHQPRTVRVLATTSDYARIHPLRLLHGRFLAPMDDHRRLRVCVASHDIVRSFPLQLPSGETLLRFADGRLCRVVGVLAPGTLGEATARGVRSMPLENTVFFPLGTWNEENGDMPVFSQLQLRMRNDALVPAAARVLKQHFTRGNTTTAGPEILVPEALLLQKHQWHRRLEQFLLGIASIVLALGIAGMSNVMLVSVDSRKREIGLRRAVGASRNDILLQFLLEGLLLAAAGGVLGILAGLLASSLLHTFLQVTVIQNTVVTLAGTLAALASGILASLYPAARAASLDPAEALRTP